MTTWTTDGLETIKKGDLVAPIVAHGNSRQWHHVLHTVTAVGKVRFQVCGDWVEKKTGYRVGNQGYLGNKPTLWVKATPEMIAELDNRQRVEAEAKAKKEAFEAREDVQAAWAIKNLEPAVLIQCMTLAQMLEILRKAKSIGGNSSESEY